MWNGIAIGIGRSGFSDIFAGSYATRVTADGGTIEALECVSAASLLLKSASLLIIPSGYKAGVAYAELPANGNGDLTWSRASSATRTLASGTIETPRTNHIRNSSMVGAVTGTPGTLPTNWIIVTVGLTQTVVGTGTENGLPYIDVRFNGTATGTNFTLGFEATNNIVASNGQTWANSAYLKVVQQPNPPVSYNLNIVERTSAGLFVTEGNQVISLTSSLTRFTIIRTLSGGATVERVQPRVLIYLVIGQTYDFTIRIASPQMELSSVATDWIPTTNSARTTFAGITQDGLSASNIPRLDYTYGSCPALLLEPQRTNLCLYSEQFNNAFHFLNNLNAFGSGSVANTTATVDPNGLNFADYIQENTSASVQHSIVDIFSGNVSGTTYTWSVFAKAAERTIIQLANNGGGGGNANYNLTTGVASLSTGVSASMQYVGNGWYRCILSYTSATTGNHNVQIRLCDASGNSTYTGNGTSGVFIWGAQLEVGAYSTTYIQTTNAAATRLVDSFTRNNIYTNGLISASGGTWYVELRNNVVYTRDNSNANINLDDSGGFNNGFVLRNSLGTSRLVIQKTISGASTNLFITTTDAVKIAIKWNGTSADVFQNGVKVVSATAFTTVALQNFITGIQVPVFIQAMALYPTPISDADCEVLTGTSYSSYSAMATALGYTIL